MKKLERGAAWCQVRANEVAVCADGPGEGAVEWRMVIRIKKSSWAEVIMLSGIEVKMLA